MIVTRHETFISVYGKGRGANRARSGLTLVEMIVALVLFAMSAVVMGTLFVSSTHLSQYARETQVAEAILLRELASFRQTEQEPYSLAPAFEGLDAVAHRTLLGASIRGTELTALQQHGVLGEIQLWADLDGDGQAERIVSDSVELGSGDDNDPLLSLDLNLDPSRGVDSSLGLALGGLNVDAFAELTRNDAAAALALGFDADSIDDGTVHFYREQDGGGFLVPVDGTYRFDHDDDPNTNTLPLPCLELRCVVAWASKIDGSVRTREQRLMISRKFQG